MCHNDSVGNSSCTDACEGGGPFYIGINLARKIVLFPGLPGRADHWQASVGIQTADCFFILPDGTTFGSCASYSKHDRLLGFSNKNVSAPVTVKQLNK